MKIATKTVAAQLTGYYVRTEPEKQALLSLIDGNLARNAFAHTSYYPSAEGALERIRFAERMIEAKDEIEDFLVCIGESLQEWERCINQWFTVVSKSMASIFNVYLQTCSYRMDAWIVGANRFEHDKAGDSEERSLQCYQEFEHTLERAVMQFKSSVSEATYKVKHKRCAVLQLF
ncbi:hypothetical protein [Vibrio mediterranei]|uniref:hypothetical protein n=1 Tax=Vibrio mediterranei TaxID=689 RepID=UPI001EFDCD6F|nr:hypothetical protein [Vibrio mediterranei]MCG9659927.1 hypothetical protein [Vibrio mediterranei]